MKIIGYSTPPTARFARSSDVGVIKQVRLIVPSRSRVIGRRVIGPGLVQKGKRLLRAGFGGFGRLHGVTLDAGRPLPDGDIDPRPARRIPLLCNLVMRLLQRSIGTLPR